MIFNHQDAFDFLPSLTEATADLIVLDMPYGVTRASWDRRPDLTRLWQDCWRVAKPEAPILAFASQPFTSVLVTSQPKAFRYELIWEKSIGSNFLDAKRKPLKVHESILVFCRKAAPYFPKMTKGEPYKATSEETTSSLYGKFQGSWTTENQGERYPRSVLRFANAKKPIRPTQKPVKLVEYLIETYTTEGALVVDPFSGGGTTAIAAINTNRTFAGCEIDAEAFQAADKRIRESQ